MVHSPPPFSAIPSPPSLEDDFSSSFVVPEYSVVVDDDDDDVDAVLIGVSCRVGVGWDAGNDEGGGGGDETKANVDDGRDIATAEANTDDDLMLLGIFRIYVLRLTVKT